MRVGGLFAAGSLDEGGRVSGGSRGAAVRDAGVSPAQHLVVPLEDDLCAVAGRAVSGEVDEPVRDHALAANRQLRPLGRDKSLLLQRAAASTSCTHRIPSS